MINNTTDNFWQAFQLLEPWSPPQVLFRLYYDENGDPIEFSHEDKLGNYIDVDPEFFREQPRNIKVVEGKIQRITPKQKVKKLTPNLITGTSCHPRDVCIVVADQHPHTKWSLKTNETN